MVIDLQSLTQYRFKDVDIGDFFVDGNRCLWVKVSAVQAFRLTNQKGDSLPAEAISDVSQDCLIDRIIIVTGFKY